MKHYELELIYHPESLEAMVETDKKIESAVGKSRSSSGGGTGDWSDLGRDMQFHFPTKQEAEQALQKVQELQIPHLDIGVSEQEMYLYVRMTHEQLARVIEMCHDTIELNRGAMKSMTEPNEQQDFEDTEKDCVFLTDLGDSLREQREET